MILIWLEKANSYFTMVTFTNTRTLRNESFDGTGGMILEHYACLRKTKLIAKHVFGNKGCVHRK